MASFNIKKVILIESSFTLDPSINPGDSVSYELEVTMTSRNKVDNNLVISVEVKVTASGMERERLANMSVRMDGLFELDAELPGPNEEYLANVNAPAIIYPFIREHIATVTAKSGIEAILIPPFNFVEHYQNMLEESKLKETIGETSEPE